MYIDYQNDLPMLIKFEYIDLSLEYGFQYRHESHISWLERYLTKRNDYG